MKTMRINKENRYIRDGRSPIPKNENTSRIMSANKAKDTKPELTLRRKLIKEGLRGYRIHYKKVSGSPDICFTTKKIAIFVNGCFWHRCPKCKLPLPKSNTVFWQTKFNNNKKRDKEKIDLLASNGWEVIVVWECEIKDDLNSVIARIRKQYYLPDKKEGI